MKTGIELITKERHEQIYKHKITPEFDFKHNSEEQLVLGAIDLLLVDEIMSDDEIKYVTPKGWDADIFLKICSKPYKERLIIAGAFIAAEIDRLQYK